MTCFETSTWMVGVVTLLGLSACRMDNPGFAEDQAEEVGDTTTGESGGSGESSDSGSSSAADTSTSTSTTASDTTDTTDTADTNDAVTTEGIELDMPGQECTAMFTEPYWPVYGLPGQFANGCPPAVTGQFLLVTGAGPSAGLVMGKRCSNEICTLGCDGESIPVGVPGLDTFSAPLLNQGNACFKVQTGAYSNVLDDSGRCRYDSMWAGAWAADNNVFVNHLLLAFHKPSPLPLAAATLVGNNLPIPGEEHVSCECAQVFDFLTEDLACCNASGTLPTTSSLSFLDAANVWPGDNPAVMISQVDYFFTVAQAQSLPGCDADPNPNPGLDTSWALVRKF